MKPVENFDSSLPLKYTHYADTVSIGIVFSYRKFVVISLKNNSRHQFTRAAPNRPRRDTVIRRDGYKSLFVIVCFLFFRQKSTPRVKRKYVFSIE